MTLVKVQVEHMLFNILALRSISRSLYPTYQVVH